MKKFFAEFRDFAMRGNVVDLAVAVIIGAAFQAIVNSLVNDIISPLIGTFLNTDFSAWAFQINGVDIKYGAFITAVVNFIIMAFVIFLMIKLINRAKRIGKKAEEPAEEKPTVKKCPYCCSEIAIEATRCPHCTSELPAEEADA